MRSGIRHQHSPGTFAALSMAALAVAVATPSNHTTVDMAFRVKDPANKSSPEAKDDASTAIVSSIKKTIVSNLWQPPTQMIPNLWQPTKTNQIKQPPLGVYATLNHRGGYPPPQHIC